MTGKQPRNLTEGLDQAIARDNAMPRERHELCGRIKPGDQRVGAACGLAAGHVERSDTCHANGRGDVWPEPKQRGPYVGPRGEAGPTGPVPSWDDDELARAEEHVRELLQRELEHAHHMATVPTHGAPAGRTQGYYAARAYLLACHLYPQRLVLGLPTEGDLELDPHAIITLPPDEPELPAMVEVASPAGSFYCGTCGTTGPDGPAEHASVCRLLVQDRAAKQRD